MGGGRVIVESFPELKRDLNQVENTIRHCVDSKVPLVREACEGLLDAGGKRLRPMLSLVSARYGRQDSHSKDIIKAAAAVEIIHMATLVHDDIIDESQLRRGRQTVQSRWGKDVAVFVGDFLLTRALVLLSGVQVISNQVVSMVARAMKYICEGEIQQFADRYSLDRGVASYLRRIRGKTAILFAVSCALGAACSRSDRKVISTLVRYGLNFGMAYQIHDDIMDFVCPAERMGKPRLHDVRTGVYTLPVIVAANDPHYGGRVSRLALNPNSTDDWADKLADAVVSSGAIRSCMDLMRRYADRASHYISNLPSSPYNRLLESLVETLRNSSASGLLRGLSEQVGND